MASIIDISKDFSLYLRKEDGDGLNELLHIFSVSGIDNEIPEDILDSTHILQNDVRQLITAYIQLQQVYLQDSNSLRLFNAYSNLITAFNKYAEAKTNWIMIPIMTLAKFLTKTAIDSDKELDSQNGGAFEKTEVENCLTKAGRILDVSKRLCLTDRNEDDRSSKRRFIYFFAGQQLKIYHKLQNIPLAKNLEKVLASKQRELPSLYEIPKSQAIPYLYYSGIIKCGESEFRTALEKFKLAFELSHRNADLKNQELILIYLIPLNFLIHKKYPKQNVFDTYPNIKVLYEDLIESLKIGDLRKFDSYFEDLEIFFLKKTLYLAIENLRNYVSLKLIRNVFKITEVKTHFNINSITKAIQYSKYHDSNRLKPVELNNDDTECLLANLIYKGLIKGYISHVNEILVLSKVDPFPKQVS
ncbi:hypothetical protein WICMUC_005604 [Wickerhamomyces mucosus]|uniref:PCI domain-containing protein n=1 Tax=Wickerhamomyces mucosus TaxID=1378264 RepID=A0A9P8T610_9ASCO|nr:hypothetical protein WICMUC_005604 [Wickerhamomyces mucosus]